MLGGVNDPPEATPFARGVRGRTDPPPPPRVRLRLRLRTLPLPLPLPLPYPYPTPTPTPTPIAFQLRATDVDSLVGRCPRRLALAARCAQGQRCGRAACQRRAQPHGHPYAALSGEVRLRG